MTQRKAKGTKPKARKKRAKPVKPQLLLAAPTEPPPGVDDGPPKARRRTFDPSYLEDLCAHIGQGDSLRSWAALCGQQHQHVIRWIQADSERQREYREARRMQADAHIDQLIELSDEKVAVSAFGTMDSAAVQDKRVRIDTRKWVAAKFYPSMYGDRMQVDASLDVSALKPDQVMAKIVELLATNGLRVLPDTGDGDGPG